MRPLVAVMLSFVLGAGAASTGWMVAQLDRSAPPPVVPGAIASPHESSVGPGAPVAPVTVVADDRVGIAHRLDGLSAKIDALAAALRSSGGRELAAGQPIDVKALAEAVSQVESLREQQRVAAMSDTELLEEARRLGQKGNDPAAAANLLERLLARDLQPAQRVDAMTELGMMKRESDPARSIATLQSAIALAGADSQAGAWASYQLVWSAQRHGDHAMALGAAEMALRSPGLHAKLRPTARFALASAAIDVGDLNRARSELQTLRGEASDDPKFAGMLSALEQRLTGR